MTLARKPLNRKLAIFLVLLILWLVGSIGLVLIHFQRWHFFLLAGHDTWPITQIGGYYLARVGAQLPALGLAAIIIGLSDFRRPVRAACFTALIYYGTMTLIRLARQPWTAAPNLDQRIPILAEVAQLILMVAFAGFFTWLFFSFGAWLQASPLGRSSDHSTKEQGPQ